MSLDVFVGRIRELERYQKFLTRETPWMLIIRGLGGSGKSTLLSELEKQTPRDTCVVTLDFAQKSLREDYLTFLENISQQVEPYCDAERTVEFRKSIASGRYEIGKRIAGGNTAIGEIKQDIITDSDVEIHDAAQTIEIAEARIEETLHQMREIAKEKFYAQMKTFTKKRLVIMIDTCEWLNEKTAEAEAARWAGTELIKGLRMRMQNQGKACFVVMASRVPLELETINPAEQEQLRLKMFDRAEVNQYLAEMEIQDLAVQDYIYNFTYGHPHCMAIIYDIWEEQWDGPIRTADLHRLKGLFYERALQEVIDKDVLRRLLKSPLDKLTRYGVLLRRFNLPLLQAVFREWLPEPEASDRFNQLIRYPHVESLGNFNYAFHMLLREILVGYIRVQEPEKWRRYHQLALDFLTPNGDSPQGQLRSPDYYYHLLACNEEQGVTYWNDIKTRAPQDYIEALRDAARDKTLKLTPATMQCMDILRDAMSNIA
jgi:predicted house-cleaning NTP pyrophosphatase (Maf/HAM1 superfamily)